MTRSRKPFREPTQGEGGEGKIELQERLQKVLAASGLGSRRDCEELITQGRVEIDRQVVTELGTKVDPLQQEIRVDGTVLHRPKRLYFAVNKPEGVVTTNFDPSGRTRVIDLIPSEERLFAIGRLDRASEGLILVTNDGDLANRVTHPRYGVEKTYHVRVEGSPDNEQLLRLRQGVRIAEGVARVQSVKVKGRHKNVSDLEIILSEGKNREIRRILAKVGHKVLKLKRIAVGPVKLGELASGASRRLMPQEVEDLLEAARSRRRENKRKPKTAEETEGQATSSAAPEQASPERAAGDPAKPDRVPTGRAAAGRAGSSRAAAGRAGAAPARRDQSRRDPVRREPAGRDSTRREPDRRGARPSPPPPRTQPTSGPPKIDLATLLNPKLAPKRAMSVNPPPAAARPSIGDVLAYDNAGTDNSVAPLITPDRKRRRPLREYATDAEPIERLDDDPQPAAATASPGDRGHGRPNREQAPRERGQAGKRPASRPGAMRRPATTGKPAGKGRPATGKPAGKGRNKGQPEESLGRRGRSKKQLEKRAIRTEARARGERPAKKKFGKIGRRRDK